MWDDERIDAALDEAARELTAGDPGPAFRARVMARIERAPKFSLPWRPLAAGLAVAAIVATAVMLRLKPDPTYDQKPNAMEVRLPSSPRGGYGGQGKPDAPDSTNAATQEVRLPPSPRGGYGGPGKPDPTYGRETPDAAYGEDLAPLTTPPLDLKSIEVPALTADESLRIDPLPPAASIAVAPLVAEPEGDRR